MIIGEYQFLLVLPWEVIMPTLGEIIRQPRRRWSPKRKLPKPTERGVAPRAEKTLRSEDFALSPSEKEQKIDVKGRYPIDTKERAIDAIVTGSQFATRSEFAKILRAVQKRYPRLKMPLLLRLVKRGMSG